MNSLHPKVTVLMPAYNTEKYISEAIQSVLDQSFRDFELLIIDDGSTDETAKVIRSFSDQRIVLIEQENQGISAALNKGLELARAPFIARFDADDVCYANRLQTQYDFMIENPEYDIVGSSADYMDVQGNYVFTYQPPAFSHEDIQRLEFSKCPFIHSSVFYKKDVILRNGGYNLYAHSFEDHFLWLNLLRQARALNLHQPLIKVRLNPASITIDEKWLPKAFKELKYAVLRKRTILEEDGLKLRSSGIFQLRIETKTGAYYALLAKKFLWNNYQPVKARKHLKKAIHFYPFSLNLYALIMLSFLPQRAISKVYHLRKTTGYAFK